MIAVDTAMVLAAGFGTRMRPLTDAVPKPLVAVGGITLLDRVLDRLRDAGIGSAVVNVHYRADQIEAAVCTRTAPVITISDERDAVLDTGGGVGKALPLLGCGPFLVHNSDSIWTERDSNLAHMMRLYDPTRIAALLLLARAESSIGYDGRGDFHLGPQGDLCRRASGESANYVFAGVSILDPRLFEGIADRAFSLNVVFDLAAAHGGLFGCVLDGTWMHVGTPDAVADAEKHLNDWTRRTA